MASYDHREPVSVPLDYTAQWIYSDCDKLKIAGSSYHQVLRITTTSGLLAVACKWLTTALELSVCSLGLLNHVPGYDITIEDLKAALNVLVGGLSVEKVFVEDYTYQVGPSSLNTVDSQEIREIHIYFEGVSSALAWPTLRIVPRDQATDRNLAYNLVSANIVGSNSGAGTHCADDSSSYANTYARVLPVEDHTACASGSSEVQVVVLESRSGVSPVLGGSFKLYYHSEASVALSYDATAAEVQTAVNTFSGVGGVTVSRYTHTTTFSGYAWAITPP